jgi:acetyltransferase-like isoleucine patch superfamily enzyme
MIVTKDFLKGDNYVIGDYTYGSPKVYVFGTKRKLYIGRFCSISECTILLGSEHIRHISTYPFATTPPFCSHIKKDIKAKLLKHDVSKGDIRIGNDVWLGMGSMILSGLTIGDGAIIGADALISRDVEPYAIMVGNPAKCIGKRFDDDFIEKLLIMRWWDWPEEVILKNINVISLNDIDKLWKVYKRSIKTK